MLRDKIKNLFKNIINYGVDTNDDVNVVMAKANYKKYQDELEEKRNNYIKNVCNMIKIESRNGSKSVVTVTLLENFMTYEFMMEMKEYFEKRGFHVEEECSCSGVLTSWLRISWE